MFKYAHIPRHCEGVARGNPLLFLKGGIRILSRYALRMTYNLVIANTYGVRLYFRLPVIAVRKTENCNVTQNGKRIYNI